MSSFVPTEEEKTRMRFGSMTESDDDRLIVLQRQPRIVQEPLVRDTCAPA